MSDSDSDSDSLERLDASELGTKEHWDSAYQLETANFLSDPTDEGQVWFSESRAEPRMLRHLASLPLPRDTTTFLDLGTGNGHLLFSLVSAGWGGKMTGVDYSPSSVALCRRIAAARGVGEEQVVFEEADIVRGEGLGGRRWDVVVDKGTFDAISLCADAVNGEGERGEEVYPRVVAGLVEVGGRVLVTSCNWTEEELCRRMEGGSGGRLRKEAVVEYPVFRFGGGRGQTVCTVCFRREN